MKSKEIRISDVVNHVVSVSLPDILKEIENGHTLKWSILYLEAIGDLEEDKSIPDFEELIDKSERGFFISWENLKELAVKFEQIIDIIILGSKDENLLNRYEEDKAKYETCDIVIEMIDSSYWLVFSKDIKLIDRLGFKFKEIEFLKPDFLEQYLNRKTQGILIFDKNNENKPVDFSEIFAEIKNLKGYWKIFFLEVQAKLGEENSTFQLVKKINESKKGFPEWWEGINLDSFMHQFQTIINLTLVGNGNAFAIQRYEDDQEMYEEHEIVVQMLNNSYWQIFSKDEKLIDRLADKFKDINFIEPDYQKKKI